MASPQGTTLSFCNNTLTYQTGHVSNGPQRTHTARAARRSSLLASERDKAVKQLTSQITHILYDKRLGLGREPVEFHNSALHKHIEVAPLLAQHEPGSQIDPDQLKVILEHLRPLVKRGDAAVVGLHRFIKQLLVLRQSWLKAAGEFYGFLAYLNAGDERGLRGPGLSCPGRHGSEGLQLAFQRTREQLETTSAALQAFKKSPAFTSNMQELVAYFAQMKAEEERCQERNHEALQRAAENGEKRAGIKRRNESVMVRQMGPMIDVDMGDELQQGILDMMTDTMQFELGVAGS